MVKKISLDKKYKWLQTDFYGVGGEWMYNVCGTRSISSIQFIIRKL